MYMRSSKKVVLFVCLMLVLALAFGCSNGKKDSQAGADNKSLTGVEQSEGEGEVIAIVNGTKIYLSDMEELLKVTLADYKRQGLDLEYDDPLEDFSYLKEDLLNELIAEELLLQDAKSMGITVTQEEIEEAIESAKNSFPTLEDFEENLKLYELEEDDLPEVVYKDILFNKYFDKVLTPVTVSESDIAELYEKYKEMYKDDIPSLEEIRQDLEQELIGEAKSEQVSKIVEELKQKGDIQILMEIANFPTRID